MKLRPPIASRIESKIQSEDITSDFFGRLAEYRNSVLFPPGTQDYLAAQAEERRRKVQADAETKSSPEEDHLVGQPGLP